MNVSIEEKLVRFIIEYQNPGVDFDLLIDKNGIIKEVLVKGEPVEVLCTGEIAGPGHSLFFDSNMEYYEEQRRIAAAKGVPPCPVLDHELIRNALHVMKKQIGEEAVGMTTTCCKGKMIGIETISIHFPFE